jgi:hypothetical protein
MKTSQPAALAAAIIAMCVTASQIPAQQPGEPSIPVGTLDAFPTVVQAGTHPTLTWNIEYPSGVMEVVDIDDDGTVTPKVDLIMELRVLGASVQTSSTNWLTVEGWVKADGASSWSRFFSGKQYNVNPTRIYRTQTVRKARPIHIGGRCYNSGWYPFYYSGSGSWNVHVLADGEIPPDTIPAYNQDEIEAFLRPYIDDSGRIEIGPKDLIFLYELAMTNPSQSAFDLQDLVVLATFKSVPSN